MATDLRMRNTYPGSDSVLLAISLNRGQVLFQLNIIGEIFQHLLQGHNTDHRHSIITFNFLNRRQLALPSFLPIQGNQHTCRLGILCPNDLHDFTDGGAGGDHVVNDQHAASQRAPTKVPPSP